MPRRCSSRRRRRTEIWLGVTPAALPVHGPAAAVPDDSELAAVRSDAHQSPTPDPTDLLLCWRGRPALDPRGLVCATRGRSRSASCRAPARDASLGMSRVRRDHRPQACLDANAGTGHQDSKPLQAIGSAARERWAGSRPVRPQLSAAPGSSNYASTSIRSMSRATRIGLGNERPPGPRGRTRRRVGNTSPSIVRCSSE
jgi:hypothetical protein